jgi:RNA polymerase sigma-70 factor (ECF subfamily)
MSETKEGKAPRTAAPSRSDEWTRLMLAARDGDRAAFDRLVEEARPAIRRRALALLQDAALADEVATQALRRAWKHRAGYDPGRANAATWLFRIADRLVTDQGRARKRLRDREVAGFESLCPAAGDDRDATVRVEPEDDVGLPAAEEADLCRAGALVESALARLPGADREVLRLFYYEELNYEQIAARLGVKPTAVGPRLTRARQRLLERLPPEALR